MGFHLTKVERDALVDDGVREKVAKETKFMLMSHVLEKLICYRFNRQRLQKHKISQFEIAVVDGKYNGEEI